MCLNVISKERKPCYYRGSFLGFVFWSEIKGFQIVGDPSECDLREMVCVTKFNCVGC